MAFEFDISTCALKKSFVQVAAMKHQGVELRHLEAENKDLKARIERQEAFHKRRMEKEKKEKRGIRSGSTTRASTVGSSGGIASGKGKAEGGREGGREVKLHLTLVLLKRAASYRGRCGSCEGWAN